MSNPKILVVEDETDIRDLIHFHLFKNKYEVFEAADGQTAYDLTIKNKPDLILLDVMIPKIDGLELCSRLKSDPKTAETKIIFISAKGSEDDVVKGLELGAEDYITKPFSPKILVAKVKTVLKRGKKQSGGVISVQGITLDTDKRKVILEDKEVGLTASEYLLLKHLISSPGHVYTRSQIVDSIKGQNHAVTDRSVDTQVVTLRKKLGEKGQLIETVWGIGYRFREDEV